MYKAFRLLVGEGWGRCLLRQVPHSTWEVKSFKLTTDSINVSVQRKNQLVILILNNTTVFSFLKLNGMGIRSPPPTTLPKKKVSLYSELFQIFSKYHQNGFNIPQVIATFLPIFRYRILSVFA